MNFLHIQGLTGYISHIFLSLFLNGQVKSTTFPKIASVCVCVLTLFLFT